MEYRLQKLLYRPKKITKLQKVPLVQLYTWIRLFVTVIDG